MEIHHSKTRLSNGLEVVLHEDHSIPIVAVDIWYHVGSKDERPGRTGLAHLFEHLMFEGSKHHDHEYFKPLQAAGASINGSTNTDRTNYYEVVPASFLELALWLESDRMGFLTEALTQDKFDNQRDVVKNERRQRYDNAPYGRAWEVLLEALYPAGHPYSWPTIGSMRDLSEASLDDAVTFFRRHYAPSNATLALAGDLDPDSALALVERYFGALEPGQPVERLERWGIKLGGRKRVVSHDRVQLPRLYLAWPAPAFFDPSDGELDVLAFILASGKTSRLFKALVYEQQIAQDVVAFQVSKELGSIFAISATARPGQTLGSLRDAIDAELDKLRAEGPTKDELAQAQNSLEAHFLTRLQSLGGANGLADQLNLYNHYLGTPDGFARDLERYRAAGVEELSRAIESFLVPERVELEVLPQAAHKAAVAAGALLDRSVQPGPSAERGFKAPGLERGRGPSGLEILAMTRRKLPIVSLHVVIKAGAAADPPAWPGLSSFTAAMLDEGTASRSALEISSTLRSIGTPLRIASDHDAVYVEITTPTKHFQTALGVLSEVLLEPAFPADELERQRRARVTRILQDRDEPGSLAWMATHRALYGPEHPYGHTELGSDQAVSALTRVELERHYAALFVPGNAAVALVGDVDAARAAELLAPLAAWPKRAHEPVVIPEPKPLPRRGLFLVDKPGAAQSVLHVAGLGEPRKTEAYYALVLVNAILGSMFTSRLNLNLREAKGYTYGARSRFHFRRARGPFIAQAAVHTEVTSEALVELLGELEAIRGDRPISAEELRFAKDYLIRRYPQGFETTADLASRLEGLALYELPESVLEDYVERIEAVALEEARETARRALKPESFAIVVVGDLKQVRAGLEALELGTTVELDPSGELVAVSGQS